jgi:hypothetical protein
MTRSELEKRFQRNDDNGVEEQWAHREIDVLMLELAYGLIEIVPEGRQREIMLWKLEEARFWANAGVSQNDK